MTWNGPLIDDDLLLLLMDGEEPTPDRSQSRAAALRERVVAFRGATAALDGADGGAPARELERGEWAPRRRHHGDADPNGDRRRDHQRLINAR